MKKVIVLGIMFCATMSLWAQQPNCEALKKSADRGDAEAMFYYAGYCAQSPEEALSYIRKSANKSYPPAQCFLGTIYETGGDGLVIQDPYEAVQWYEESAERGYNEAQYYLGNCYMNGFGGLSQNENEAVKLWKKSAEKSEYFPFGYFMAQMTLGYFYLEKEEYSAALCWFEKAKTNADDTKKEVPKEYHEEFDSQFNIAELKNIISKLRSEGYSCSSSGRNVEKPKEDPKATYVRTDPDEVKFDANKGGTKDITVNSDGKSYSVSDVPDWCTFKTNNGYFTLTCQPNKGEARTANIKVTVDSKTCTVKVEQPEAQATYLRTNTEEIKLSALGDTKNVSVYTDGYNLTYSTPPSWLTVSGTTSSINFSAKKNREQKRSAVITLTSGDYKTDVTITQPQEATYLNIENNSIRFSPKGGAQTVNIQTDGDEWVFLNKPSWINAEKNGNKLTLKCNENSGQYSGNKRNGQITIKSDNESTIINLFQKAVFNSPKGDERLFGFSAGYVMKQWVQKNENGTQKYGVWEDETFINGIQTGVRIEPLFKYGLGLSTGLFYEYYFSKSKEFTGTFIDAPGTFRYRANYNEHLLYIPVHFEYRANISENFQFFVTAGPSVDIGLATKVTATETGEKEPYYTETNIYGNTIDGMGHKRFNFSVDVGGGFRANGLQLNVGTSFGLLNISAIPNTSIKQNKLLTATLSWMIPHESWSDIPVNSANRGTVGKKGKKKERYGEHGLDLGYISKQWEWKSDTYTGIYNFWESGKAVPGFRLGYTYQPSFGYGFGIATGLNFDTYLSKSDNIYDEYGSYHMFFSEMAINIPVHGEYRLHFAKIFSIFFEFGPSLDIGLFSQMDVKSNGYETYTEKNLYEKSDWGYPTGRLNVYLDFIGGFRIWKFQLSAGISRGLMPVSVIEESVWEVRQNRNLMVNLGIFF